MDPRGGVISASSILSTKIMPKMDRVDADAGDDRKDDRCGDQQDRDDVQEPCPARFSTPLMMSRTPIGDRSRSSAASVRFCGMCRIVRA